jgi:hypothetical protein
LNDASPEFLRRQADRFRKLAREIVDEHGRRELIKLADEYEPRAADLSGYKSD